MHRSSSLVWPFATAFLSLLTLVSAAEAFGRCRSRQQCVSACAPVGCCQPMYVCQGCVYGSCPRDTKCMDCINGTWQQPTNPDDPCTDVEGTLEGCPCVQKGKLPEVGSGPDRLYRGCGLWYNWRTRQWIWYSNKLSTEHCDASKVWSCRCRIIAIPRGICLESGLFAWDIYKAD